MNALVGIGLYIVLFIIGIFLFVCGLMTAFIIPTYMSLHGFGWIAVFLSTLGVVWGSGGGSLITVINRD